MILIADSGSTKIEWCVLDEGKVVAQVFTVGMNAMLLTEEEMAETIKRELMPHIGGMAIDEVYYYGAGCLFDNICNNVIFFRKYSDIRLSSIKKSFIAIPLS